MRHASEGGGPGAALNSAGYAEAAGYVEAAESLVGHVEVVYAIVYGGLVDCVDCTGASLVYDGDS